MNNKRWGGGDKGINNIYFPNCIIEEQSLPTDVDGLNDWKHFGDTLLHLHAVELRSLFEGSKTPSLAIVDKWIAKYVCP